MTLRFLNHILSTNVEKEPSKHKHNNNKGTFCKAIKAASLLAFVVDLTTSLIQIFNSA